MEQIELNLAIRFQLIPTLFEYHSITVSLVHTGICFTMKHLPSNLYPVEFLYRAKRCQPKDLNKFVLNILSQCTLACST